MSTIYSPSRTSATSRLPLGGAVAAAGGGGGVSGASRLRSSSLKKPPEPLRRAVADCLSSSSSPAHHGTPSATASEASRTLRVRPVSLFFFNLGFTTVLSLRFSFLPTFLFKL